MSSRTTSLAGRGSGSCSPPNGVSLPTPPPMPPSSSSPAHIEQLRQTLSNGLHAHPELRDLLGLCAESNDWSVEEARQRPDTVVQMELFLLQVPRVPIVKYFPHLVTIKLMNIGLESTSDFASLTHVEELWLSDNNIRAIEGLENMTKLRRLYLQGNCIASLDGLPPLRHLRELWLSRNRLHRLAHLTPLRKLRALYVADNPIECLDGAFSKDMTRLHDVNLSACHLADIAQLCYLQQLPCLRNVWFADPLFGENPICRMNNYTTLVLSMLDSLDCLDGTYVAAEQRSLVESVLGNKKSYYEMRVQMLETHLVLLARHAEACALQEAAQSAEALAQLQAHLQPIETELMERQLYHAGDGGNASENAHGAGPRLDGTDESQPSTGAPPGSAALVERAVLESTRRQLARAAGTWEIQEQRTLLRLAQAINAAAMQAQLLKERLAVELHTAGNVRLEPVSATHDFFTSVEALVQDRFHRELYEQQLGITSVTVKSVRRIVNRGLRLRFDNRVKELHVDLANPQHRSRFVGLFGVVPTTLEEQSTCLQHVLLHGADADDHSSASASTAPLHYAPTPQGEGVPLTDSLFFADEMRLRALCGAGGSEGGASNSASTSLAQVYSDGTSSDSLVCHGQLVLYRTYLGKAVCALGSVCEGGAKHGEEKKSAVQAATIERSFVQKAGRVLKKDYGDGITAAYRTLPTATGSPGQTTAAAEATPRPAPSYMWYCFDRALVLADCVVDYVYTLPSSSQTGQSSSASLVATTGVATPQLDPVAVAALLSAVCPPCGVGAGGGGHKERGTSAADTGREVREDLLTCATPLLQFIQWCGELSSEPRLSGNAGSSSRSHKHKARSSDVAQGNTLKMAAVKETAEAIAGATAALGESVVSQLVASTRKRTADMHNATIKGVDSNPSRPMQAEDVERYVSRLHITEGGLTLCVLRGLGITAVWKDLACPLLSTVTTLDLSYNSITDFSWFAVAKEAPQLVKLNLCGNEIASFLLDGSRLPTLRVLNLSENRIGNVLDFRNIRSAAPALEELDLRGNPLLLTTRHRQEAEARLWLFLAPSPLCQVSAMKLNQRAIGGYPGTLATQRYRRTCVLPSDTCASMRATHVVEHLLLRLRETSSSAGAAAAAALFSVDGASVPERYVNAAVTEIEQWEAAGTTEECLAEASRTRQRRGSGNVAASQCFSDCQDFSWSYAVLEDVSGLAALLPNLRRVVLRGHALTNIDALLQLSRLESLNVAENHLTTLPCLAGLKALKELVVDFNELSVLGKEMGPLPALRLLSASGNNIAQVDASLFVNIAGGNGDAASEALSGTAPAPQLEALHLTLNAIADMNVIYALRDITSLLILSVMGNPCTLPDAPRIQRPEADAKAAPGDTRQYLIHVFPQLKVLDGGAISAVECARAREVYAGKVNTDLLIEKAHGQPDTWPTTRSLNLSHCTLTEVTLLGPFVGLEVLQLQHNILSYVSGLSTLTRLKVLDLSHNRIGTAAWRSANHTSTSTAVTSNSLAAGAAGAAASSAAQPAVYVALGDALAPLKQLESLSIESNQITDLSVLKLRLPKLKFLNARNNDLQFVQRGLEHLPELRELLLDQNKLRGLSADCLAGSKRLAVLSAENNALKSLEGLRGCARLEQLRLGANRLGELKAALYDLQTCPLKALVLIGNPVARKSNYRNTVIAYFPQLGELDRRVILPEEREKAAAARVTEYVAPPNVVIDMDFLSAAGSPSGVALPMTAGVNGNAISDAMTGVNGGLPSRSRLSNPSAAIPNGMRRGGGGAAGAGTDRFSVNPRSRAYRR